MTKEATIKRAIQDKIHFIKSIFKTDCKIIVSDPWVSAEYTINDVELMAIGSTKTDSVDIYMKDEDDQSSQVYKNVGAMIDEGNRTRFLKNEYNGHLIDGKTINIMLNNYTKSMEEN